MKQKLILKTFNAFVGRFRILNVAVLLSLIFVSSSFASVETSLLQQQEIKGIVTDSDNSPLPGVNILVVGTTTGAETDFDGKYAIKASKGDVLQFSYIGMKTKLVTVGSSNSINLSMETDGTSLDEIVIVGYGSQSRAKITGAVATVSADDIISSPTTNVSEALQGKASGVTIINNGSPGSAPTVRIRGIGTLGNNSPAFVVDGIVTDNIDSLSADDVESISVLKDASTTAVYGSLGANGVVVITTKTGKQGDVKIGFNSYVNSIAKPESLDLLNSNQYVDYISDMILNADPTAALPTRFSDAAFINNNENYQDAIFQSGSIQNVELNVSGGAENSNFRLSGLYQTQEGTMINTGVDKYSFRANSNFKKNKFSFGETVSISYTKRNPLVLAFNQSPLVNAITMAPYLPIHDVNSIGGFSELTIDDGNGTRNPLRTLNRETQLSKNINVLGNVYGKYQIIEGLEYTANAGMNFYDEQFKNVELPFGVPGSATSQSETRVTYLNSRANKFTFNNSLEYKKTIKDHSVKMLLLAESQGTKRTSLSGSGANNLDLLTQEGSLSGTAKEVEYNKAGYLARLNYEYSNKYMFAASLRRDASSRFGTNQRWGTFPSLAAGWIVSNEDFMNSDGKMNYLKVRGSWGVAGNDNIADYSYESSLLPSFFYGVNAGLAIKNLPNPELKWEETAMTNIGIDLAFLNNKVTLSGEYYSNKSTDLLMGVPAAASVGVPSNTIMNIGGMTTDGIEINLGYKKNEGDFTWSANFNLSTTNNEVTQLSENLDVLYAGSSSGILDSASISRTVEGESLWHFYGWQTDGVFQNQAEIDAHAVQAVDDPGTTIDEGTAPGDIRFKDTNGRDEEGNLTGIPDGVIDADDRVVLGNPFPKMNYGLSLNGDYKNFDMAILFTGVEGNDVFNATRYYLDGGAGLTNAGSAVLDRWTTSNPSNSQPRAINGDPNGNTRTSDRYVEDGSYFRLKNISLGYNFSPTSLANISKGSISKLRVYVSAQNLLTLTDYSGYDPEIGAATTALRTGTGNSNSEIGIDRGQYPMSKSFLMGLQIKF